MLLDKRVCVEASWGFGPHRSKREREKERTSLTGNDDFLEGMFAFKEDLRVCVNSSGAG